MVELATLTAMLSLLTTSLGTLQQTIAEKLVSSNIVALEQTSSQARRAGAPIALAKAAYRAAPYRKPALRYVYALGWISGTRHKTACALAHLDLTGTRSSVIGSLRRSSATLAVIRKLHLTVAQAGTAFTAGFASACG
jgi:hypothetical protein